MTEIITLEEKVEDKKIIRDDAIAQFNSDYDRIITCSGVIDQEVIKVLRNSYIMRRLKEYGIE